MYFIFIINLIVKFINDYILSIIMRILYFLNSDFGIAGTIGFRVKYTIDAVKKNNIDYEVFCRDYNKNLKDKYNLKRIIPFGNFSMKVLTAIPIYICRRFPSNKIKNFLFEYFLIQKLKKINLEEVDLIQSWEFLPNVFKYIKKKNPNVNIIKDMVMAFPIILKDLKKDEYIKSISFKLDEDTKNSLPYIDYYISPSLNTTESLILSGVKKHQILYNNYGVDIKKFRPLKNKDYLGTFRVAFAGNINYRKGIKYLVHAWKELNLENAELNLYGHVYTEARDMLKNALKYNIFCRGYVDLAKELKKNLVYVHPSMLETTPKILKESMASGLVPITTYYSGPDFKDKKEGFIIRTQNFKDIKEKLKYLYDNRYVLEKMAKKSRKHAENFTWEDYGNRICLTYKEIIGNKS